MGQGFCMLALSFAGCNGAMAIVFLTAATAIHGAVSSGTLASVVDLSPNYAGKFRLLISLEWDSRWRWSLCICWLDTKKISQDRQGLMVVDPYVLLFQTLSAILRCQEGLILKDWVSISRKRCRIHVLNVCTQTVLIKCSLGCPHLIQVSSVGSRILSTIKLEWISNIGIKLVDNLALCKIEFQPIPLTHSTINIAHFSVSPIMTSSNYLWCRCQTLESDS